MFCIFCLCLSLLVSIIVDKILFPLSITFDRHLNQLFLISCDHLCLSLTIRYCIVQKLPAVISIFKIIVPRTLIFSDCRIFFIRIHIIQNIEITETFVCGSSLENVVQIFYCLICHLFHRSLTVSGCHNSRFIV